MFKDATSEGERPESPRKDGHRGEHKRAESDRELSIVVDIAQLSI